MAEADSVVRCPACGGPLRGTEGKFVVQCIYCDSECRLGSKVAEEQAKQSEEMFRRMQEAEEIEKDSGPKIEEIEQKMQKAVEDGRNEDAVRYFEGYMRLQTLAAQHMMGDNFDYFDKVVEPAVKDFARSMEVDYPL